VSRSEPILTDLNSLTETAIEQDGSSAPHPPRSALPGAALSPTAREALDD
jgi:hypothetical protein